MLDELDRRILGILAANARVSLKELAQEVGLSSPSAAERLRKLEERGVLDGFTIALNPVKLGYPLQAIIRVRPMPGMLHIVEKLIQETPQIVECDKVTGDDCFIAKLFVRDMGELDTLLDRIAEKAQTNTSIVKSTPVKRRLPPLI
ncbi:MULTISPECIES: Lrp/AsnC family transcriptional regulator [Ensifer]|jgi:Lrp/AsnC family leucine-responsive transcriptional regulator|uniref:Winged helix-turn-helix transcriptional regulator n=1 Tax=Ensifer canadensis TaxID=555315 RepID=A0AAW4FG35_9HYPH|nr:MULTISPECIES: Lrp/AsnC family transcriptional regulator [Ensifer]AHK43144.1 putative transcriptional regulator protein, AsnC family [Ensifer adhaerens OV14]MDP9628713.1 Lrp/AsnC family leucine-responsive transcriptional regulator [Ensifer adhaerens]KQU98359.1 AsnC family transcriptional regulator [Ensifer sp. Root31]KQW63118.1 AsnC family transcriptional regulator [Ensifer sp. Root1252]KQW85134.1 AsnC family transcriptional regulator [Ensifer sp. Root127]